MDTGGAHRVIEIYNPGSEIKHTSNQFLLASGNFQAPFTTIKLQSVRTPRWSLHRKLEIPLTPQTSLPPVSNSWPEITTVDIFFSPQNDPETVA